MNHLVAMFTSCLLLMYLSVLHIFFHNMAPGRKIHCIDMDVNNYIYQ